MGSKYLGDDDVLDYHDGNDDVRITYPRESQEEERQRERQHYTCSDPNPQAAGGYNDEDKSFGSGEDNDCGGDNCDGYDCVNDGDYDGDDCGDDDCEGDLTLSMVTDEGELSGHG